MADGAERGDGVHVVRLVPKAGYLERTSAQDVIAQAELVRNLDVPSDSILLAPSGWLREPWVASRPDRRLHPMRDAAELVKHAKDQTLTRIGAALRSLPARVVVFGVDFYDEEECEAQFLFVFDKKAKKIIHTTSKFSGRDLSTWLCSIHDLSTHLTRLPVVGSVLLLNCDDLAALKARKKAVVQDGEWLRRIRGVERLIRDAEPKGLLHIGHNLGTPATWRNPISEVLNKHQHFRWAASTARHDRRAANGHRLGEYTGLARGCTATTVELIPS